MHHTQKWIGEKELSASLPYPNSRFRPIKPKPASNHSVLQGKYINVSNLLTRPDSSLSGKLPSYSRGNSTDYQVSIEQSKVFPSSSKCTAINIPPEKSFIKELHKDGKTSIYFIGSSPPSVGQLKTKPLHNVGFSKEVLLAQKNLSDVITISPTNAQKVQNPNDYKKCYKNIRNIYSTFNESISKKRSSGSGYASDISEDGKVSHLGEELTIKRPYSHSPEVSNKDTLLKPSTIQIIPNFPPNISIDLKRKDVGAFQMKESFITRSPIGDIQSRCSPLPESLSLKQHQLAAKAEHLKLIEEAVRQQEEEAQIRTWEALKEQEAALIEKEESLRYREMIAHKKYAAASKLLEESRKLKGNQRIKEEFEAQFRPMDYFEERVPINYCLSDHGSLQCKESFNLKGNIDSSPSFINPPYLKAFPNNSQMIPEPHIKSVNDQFSCKNSYEYIKNPRGRKPKKLYTALDKCAVQPSIEPSKIVRTYSRKNNKRQCVQSYTKTQQPEFAFVPIEEQNAIDLAKTPKEQVLVNEAGSITITQLPKFDQLISYSALPYLRSVSNLDKSPNTTLNTVPRKLQKCPSRIDNESSPYSSSSDISISFADKVQKLTSSINLPNQSNYALKQAHQQKLKVDPSYISSYKSGLMECNMKTENVVYEEIEMSNTFGHIIPDTKFHSPPNTFSKLSQKDKLDYYQYDQDLSSDSCRSDSAFKFSKFHDNLAEMQSDLRENKKINFKGETTSEAENINIDKNTSLLNASPCPQETIPSSITEQQFYKMECPPTEAQNELNTHGQCNYKNSGSGILKNATQASGSLHLQNVNDPLCLQKSTDSTSGNSQCIPISKHVPATRLQHKPIKMEKPLNYSQLNQGQIQYSPQFSNSDGSHATELPVLVVNPSEFDKKTFSVAPGISAVIPQQLPEFENEEGISVVESNEDNIGDLKNDQIISCSSEKGTGIKELSQNDTQQFDHESNPDGDGFISEEEEIGVDLRTVGTEWNDCGTALTVCNKKTDSTANESVQTSTSSAKKLSSNSQFFTNCDGSSQTYVTETSVDNAQTISNKTKIYNENLQINNIQNIILDINAINGASVPFYTVNMNNPNEIRSVNSTALGSSPVILYEPGSVSNNSNCEQNIYYQPTIVYALPQTVVQGVVTNPVPSSSTFLPFNTKIEFTSQKAVQFNDKEQNQEAAHDLSTSGTFQKTQNYATLEPEYNKETEFSFKNVKSLKEIALTFLEKIGLNSVVEKPDINFISKSPSKVVSISSGEPTSQNQCDQDENSDAWSNCSEILGLPDEENALERNAFDSNANVSVIDAFNMSDISTENEITVEKNEAENKVSRGGRILKLKEWWPDLTLDSTKRSSKLIEVDVDYILNSPDNQVHSNITLQNQVKRKRGRSKKVFEEDMHVLRDITKPENMHPVKILEEGVKENSTKPMKEKKGEKTSKEKSRLSKNKTALDGTCFWTETAVPVDFTDSQKIICGKCDVILISIKDFKTHAFDVHYGLARIKGESQEFDDKTTFKILTALFAYKKVLHCNLCDKRYRSVLGFKGHLSVCGLSYAEAHSTCPHCHKDIKNHSFPAHIRAHAEKKRSLEQMKDIVVEESKEDCGRKMRKAAKFCHDQMKLLYESIETEKTDEKDEDFEEEEDELMPINKSHFNIDEFNINMKKHGSSKCVNDGCEASFTTFSSLEQHLKECNKAKKGLKICKICHISLRKNEMFDHMSTVHVDCTSSDSDSFSENDDDSFECDDLEGELRPKASGERKQPYYLAKKFTIDFRNKNYSDHIFPEFKCQKEDWIPVLESEAHSFKPKVLSSPHFKCTSKAKDKNSIPWGKLEVFTGGKMGSGEIFFAGGPIRASAWCPTPVSNEAISQYVAVSCLSDPDQKFLVRKSEKHKGLIQIWNCGDLAELQVPFLEFCIAHECGVAWSLNWCPSGIYERPENYINRLGLLAVAFSDGSIRMYAVPHPQQLLAKQKIFKKKADITLLPFNGDKLNLQCLKVSWSPFKGHNLIAGSFSNGMVCIWDILSKPPLLNVSDDKGNLILYPINSIHAHNGYCSTVSFCPTTNGQHIVTGGSDRMIKFWDLHQPEQPLTSIRRGIITDSVWLSHWAGSFVCFDDVFSIGKTSTTFRENGFHGSHFRSIMGANATVCSISGSEWLNAIAQVDEAGEVIVSIQNNLACETSSEKNMSKKRFPLFSITLESLENGKLLFLHEEYKSRSLNQNKQKSYFDVNNVTNSNTTSQPVFAEHPLTFDKAVSMYGLKIVDQEYKVSQLYKEEIRNKQLSELMEPGPINIYPLMGASSVSWNNNFGAHTWLFVGLNSGLGRVIPVSCLDRG